MLRSSLEHRVEIFLHMHSTGYSERCNWERKAEIGARLGCYYYSYYLLFQAPICVCQVNASREHRGSWASDLSINTPFRTMSGAIPGSLG
jgi:hypothetical protein